MGSHFGCCCSQFTRLDKTSQNTLTVCSRQVYFMNSTLDSFLFFLFFFPLQLFIFFHFPLTTDDARVRVFNICLSIMHMFEGMEEKIKLFPHRLSTMNLLSINLTLFCLNVEKNVRKMLEVTSFGLTKTMNFQVYSSNWSKQNRALYKHQA